MTSARGTFDVNGMHMERTRYLESPESFTDDHFGQYDLSCGSLTERLISCLLREDLLSPNEVNGHEDEDVGPNIEDEDNHMDTTEVNNDQPTVAATEPTLYPPERIVNFEDRLKRELRYAGLLVDDDVSSTLKKCQVEYTPQLLTTTPYYRLIGIHEKTMRCAQRCENSKRT